eukprot:TRINITY_DN72195_c0_g1_i1.p1 TRINITY_DN72195_c0_g1~~TRINITY_DN72195_c0_g1_i1.p1  ORF type:complete len:512 (+),score=96.25 TRINITY_DN72195_c0_g1_i1:114-1649(+)
MRIILEAGFLIVSAVGVSLWTDVTGPEVSGTGVLGLSQAPLTVSGIALSQDLRRPEERLGEMHLALATHQKLLQQLAAAQADLLQEQSFLSLEENNLLKLISRSSTETTNACENITLMDDMSSTLRSIFGDSAAGQVLAIVGGVNNGICSLIGKSVLGEERIKLDGSKEKLQKQIDELKQVSSAENTSSCTSKTLMREVGSLFAVFGNSTGKQAQTVVQTLTTVLCTFADNSTSHQFQETLESLLIEFKRSALGDANVTAEQAQEDIQRQQEELQQRKDEIEEKWQDLSGKLENLWSVLGLVLAIVATTSWLLTVCCAGLVYRSFLSYPYPEPQLFPLVTRTDFTFPWWFGMTCDPDWRICFCSFCCLPVRWAATASAPKLPENTRGGWLQQYLFSFWGLLLGYCALYTLGLLSQAASGWLLLGIAVANRQRIRKAYGMPYLDIQSCSKDIFMWCCCAPCASMQEALEIELVGTPFLATNKPLQMSVVQEADAPLSPHPMGMARKKADECC